MILDNIVAFEVIFLERYFIKLTFCSRLVNKVSMY